MKRSHEPVVKFQALTWKFSPPAVMFPFTTRTGFGWEMTPVMFWRTSREYVRWSVVIVAPSRYRSDATASGEGTASTNRTEGLPPLYSAAVRV